MSRFRCAALAIVCTLAACSSDDTVTAPVRPNTPNPNASMGTLTALVDDSMWVGGYVSAQYGGGLLRVTAIGWGLTDDRNYLDLLVETTRGSAPQSIGPGQPPYASYNQEFYAAWVASGNQGSGVITLTSLTEDHAVGTFTFTAALASVHSPNGPQFKPVRDVRNGRFDVRLR